ncbi:MAG: hypothetical protein JSR77_07780 [Planctomycetes bacterium]|nr:hypothetical protein [Planctomycetota bacterium]
MRTYASAAILVLAANFTASGWAWAGPDKDDRLPIRAITLYRSGVGSFERRGQIDGDATVQLRFNTDQVNDILKSMIVLDLSGNGRIDGVSYGSRDPLAKRLSSFGVDISDEPSLGALLGRLRGAKVTMTMPEGPWTGTILGGETRPESKGPGQAIQVPYVNILTAAGIKSLNLTQALSVDLQDKDLASELQRALTAVAEHRADRTKTVDVTVSGQGSREIVVGYVQEAPVWKASYRLVLPDEGKDASKPGQVTLQGWAIVENTTDEDWSSVVLSLVSGRPVSFRMDLYQPLYVTRPEVPVPTVPGVAPRIFEGGTGGAGEKQDAEAMGKEVRAARRAVATPGKPAAAPAPASASPFRETGASESFGSLSADDMASYAAKSQASAVESGEVFEYQLDHPVTIERQRSAMLPIISDAVTGKRVSIFSAADGSKYPMRGIEMTNSTKLELLPGPISVYDHGTYAGDAQIGHVPAGDKRLLAYSVDLSMTCDTKDGGEDRIQKVRIVKGLAEITSLKRVTRQYSFTNKDAARGRSVIVEHPLLPGWDLKAPEKPYETTESLYRLALNVEKGKQGVLEVVQERIESTTIALMSVGVDGLVQYRKSGGKVSDKVMDAMREAQRRQGLVLDARKKIETLEKEKAGIDTDQGRIRSNMSTIDKTSELYGRYMKKLTEQESRLESIATELDKARAEQTRLEADLSDFLASLDVE